MGTALPKQESVESSAPEELPASEMPGEFPSEADSDESGEEKSDGSNYSAADPAGSSVAFAMLQRCHPLRFAKTACSAYSIASSVATPVVNSVRQ